MMLLLMGTASSLGAANMSKIRPDTNDIKNSQQTSTCTGTVKDPTGETVIGASVMIKGTTNGSITDIDGRFSIPNVRKGDVIQISYIGFQTVEIVFEGKPLEVTLTEDSQALDEVVVTALGIKREKKALGYAMQEVKGESLVNARETNLANALSGKIAGVQVIRSSNGPGGSSKIQLRGANSVTGTNQPLIVVDGVPMDNFTGADNADFYNPSLDMGNGLSDLNAEDIESMSVLKGASAAALYGSRAGNGVILITTKKGVKKEGLGITISASVSAETIFMQPEMQTSFGQGTAGQYNSESSYSWGPAMGTEYMFNGQSRRMQYYDNLDSYFRTGTNFTESISFSQMFGKTSIYASATRMDDASKIPGSSLDRTNFTLRASSTFGKDDRWSFDGKIQYIRTGAENRPMTGNNDSNRFRSIYILPSSIDIRDYSNPLTEDGTMNWWSPSGLNYDSWIFLDATFRNDWTSTLSKDNRSFFYPSVSLSWVFSDMMSKFDKPLPQWITYLKARASYAQVGNDMDPYQLYDSYSIGSDRFGNTTASSNSTKFDSTVCNELVSSWEVGVEMRFFNNCLGFDFAWYKSNAKHQLMKIPMNQMSGYSSRMINAGNIQNTGVELTVTARPVETENFSWDTQINFSKNNNKILDLGPGIERYELGGAAELKVYAVAGGNYGEIWGTKFARVTDESSPYYGKLILNDAGLPTTDGEMYKIGDQQPDCMIGWGNTFNYKNFSLGLQFDGRIGGDIYSYTNYLLQIYGRADVTAPGGNREKFVVDGVISDGNGGYTVNTTPVSQEEYWRTGIGTGNTGIGEANIYDGTNFRLRNISLSYSFPRSMLKNTCFQQAKLGFSVNNVWMIYSDMNGIDPESVFITDTNATGFENGSSPTSRTFLFNVTLGF